MSLEDTPNTLINEDLETFFAYFQTLAVSVNLYAIIDAIQDLFGVSEHELMSLLKQILKMKWQLFPGLQLIS